jgi:glycosyltransferase involved in cell wall biosynthesis
VAVGRLVPVKRFPALIDALAVAKRDVPALRAVIVGEGYARPVVEQAIAAHDAAGWIELAGRCDDDELVALYRRAWVLASASQREGWGMTVTEAAACGTPAVATRIAGHADAVEHGVSGLLVDSPAELASALTAVLQDRVLRERLHRGALTRAGELSWEATAMGTLQALLDEHRARRG